MCYKFQMKSGGERRLLRWPVFLVFLLSSLLYVHTAHEPLDSYNWYQLDLKFTSELQCTTHILRSGITVSGNRIGADLDFSNFRIFLERSGIRFLFFLRYFRIRADFDFWVLKISGAERIWILNFWKISGAERIRILKFWKISGAERIRILQF